MRINSAKDLDVYKKARTTCQSSAVVPAGHHGQTDLKGQGKHSLGQGGSRSPRLPPRSCVQAESLRQTIGAWASSPTLN